MRKIKKSKMLQEILRKKSRQGKSVGFVPTMGALHEGHLSLVRKARRENDLVVVSIFVNPLQFGPKEDLKKYPRPLGQDLALLQKEKADFVFLPQVDDLYPDGSGTFVDYEPRDSNTGHSLTAVLCGKFRPGHFRGVMTVVAKLFNIVRPDRAYFGAKDYQQARVIDRMNQDLDFGVDLRVLPIVREKDGLAMSSRNRYLSAEERARARLLYAVLSGVRREIQGGSKVSLKKLRERACRELSVKFDRIQYVEFSDPLTLKRLTRKQPSMLLAAACYLGKTRLLDNVIIKHHPKKGLKGVF